MQCPALVLWGGEGFVGRAYDVLEVWRGYAADVRGQALAGGHFLAEESPEPTLAALRDFLAGRDGDRESRPRSSQVRTVAFGARSAAGNGWSRGARGASVPREKETDR